jgi:4-amino-4-deoxy-L-arabinose transferase-like glycosyltransferase
MILFLALLALVAALVYFGVTKRRPIYLAGALGVVVGTLLVGSWAMGNWSDKQAESSPRQVCAGENSPENPCR